MQAENLSHALGELEPFQLERNELTLQVDVGMEWRLPRNGVHAAPNHIQLDVIAGVLHVTLRDEEARVGA